VLKAGVRPTEHIPAPRDDLDVFDLMRSRRSCRSFQRRDLTPVDREALLESARVHAAQDRQIGSSPIRFEYVAEPLTVWPVIGAHEFFVAIAPRQYDRMAVIDVGRSLQKVVLDATRMGIATCWIGPGADHASILHHLGNRFDPARDHIICVCAVGYESRFKPLTVNGIQFIQHRRKPLDDLFFADSRMERSLDIGTPPFSAFGRCYEVCQWSPSSYNGQTTRCVGVAAEVDGETEASRFDFYAATDSRFYAPVALGIWLANWETGCGALDIPGHMEVLTPEDREVGNAPEPPCYDVSWVAD